MTQHRSQLIDRLTQLTSDITTGFEDIFRQLAAMTDRDQAEEIVTRYLFRLTSVSDWMKYDTPEQRAQALQRHLQHTIHQLERDPITGDTNVTPLRPNGRPATKLDERQSHLSVSMRSMLGALKLILGRFRELPSESLRLGRITFEPRSQQGPYLLFPSILSNLEVRVDCDFSAVFDKTAKAPSLVDVLYREHRGVEWVSLQTGPHPEALLQDVYITLEEGIEVIHHWFEKAQAS